VGRWTFDNLAECTPDDPKWKVPFPGLVEQGTSQPLGAADAPYSKLAQLARQPRAKTRACFRIAGGNSS
jgi:hypothetical protein